MNPQLLEEKMQGRNGRLQSGDSMASTLRFGARSGTSWDDIRKIRAELLEAGYELPEFRDDRSPSNT